MRNFFIGLLVFIALFATVGGYLYLKAMKYMPSVQQYIDQYYSFFNDQDPKAIYNNLVDQDFKDSIPADQFDSLLKGIYSKLGPVNKKEMGSWKMDEKNKEVFFEIQYTVTHERGEAVESFMLFKDGDSWKLLKYNIKSNALTINNSK